jgi:hypothetical protein
MTDQAHRSDEERRYGLEAWATLQRQVGEAIGDSTDLRTAQAAATKAARLAWERGWARGPIWLAVGPQLLLLDWAVSHGVRIQTRTDGTKPTQQEPFRLEE